ncbi:uncharacterized protein AMSG_08105 [Thecamonas trahens ATCC 50062]|uniref:Uncharacterized protein n=1 Tax=Thecamonas trahens ATCC 50062 TaxID=461836 RepID=A0A0L0DMB8_THETB|nr:hypothetical protein AMSG_08105 [Thecamonas trahens ATCC 50062]KNC52538.1 hypothetical protein AMSG_08105 [Thecamonas trahens ATCC 50062]|eukprot:XP_013755329.1 hypothetical protein AMSG_08105 [Thecamonas trahens ATCC 50062]
MSGGRSGRSKQQTCIMVFGIVYNASIDGLLCQTEAPKLKRTRSGRHFGVKKDVHDYWISKWLAANGLEAGNMDAEEIDDALAELGVQGSYLALHTVSYTFSSPKYFDWRACQTFEKTALGKIDKLREFCALFGITYTEPSWLQVGYEW